MPSPLVPLFSVPRKIVNAVPSDAAPVADLIALLAAVNGAVAAAQSLFTGTARIFTQFASAFFTLPGMSSFHFVWTSPFRFK